jgi:hypothetical protein
MSYSGVDRTSGISYGWMCIAILTVICGVLYAVLSGMFTNDLINGPNGDQSVGINHDIKAGYLSQQARGAISFNIEMEKDIPLILCTGFFIFAVARAIAVKGGG